MDKKELNLETKLYLENGKYVGTVNDFIQATMELALEELTTHENEFGFSKEESE